jgi:hypothetical protein
VITDLVRLFGEKGLDTGLSCAVIEGIGQKVVIVHLLLENPFSVSVEVSYCAKRLEMAMVSSETVVANRVAVGLSLRRFCDESDEVGSTKPEP